MSKAKKVKSVSKPAVAMVTMEKENQAVAVKGSEPTIDFKGLNKEDGKSYTLIHTPEQARELLFSEDKFKSKFINPIGKSAKEMRDLVHVAAMQALARAYGNDNFDYIKQLHNTLENALSEAAAKQLRDWFLAFSPSRFVQLKDKSWTFRKDKGDNAKPFDFEKAFANPWYNVKVLTFRDMKDFSLDNVEKAIKRLITTGKETLAGTSKQYQLADESERGAIAKEIAFLERHLEVRKQMLSREQGEDNDAQEAA